MNKHEYNGWFNYETWNVNLWLTNEQDSYDLISELINNPYSDRAVYDLADALQEYVEDMNPLAGSASMFSDLLGAALSEVNWDEIAEHWIEDYRSDNPNPEEQFCRVCANEITDKNDAGDGYCSACYAMLPDAYDGNPEYMSPEEKQQHPMYWVQTYEEWCAENPMVDQPALPTDYVGDWHEDYLGDKYDTDL